MIDSRLRVSGREFGVEGLDFKGLDFKVFGEEHLGEIRKQQRGSRQDGMREVERLFLETAGEVDDSCSMILGAVDRRFEVQSQCGVTKILCDWRHVVPLLGLDVATMKCRGAGARRQELHFGSCAAE